MRNFVSILNHNTSPITNAATMTVLATILRSLFRCLREELLGKRLFDICRLMFEDVKLLATIRADSTVDAAAAILASIHQS